MTEYCCKSDTAIHCTGSELYMENLRGFIVIVTHNMKGGRDIIHGFVLKEFNKVVVY